MSRPKLEKAYPQNVTEEEAQRWIRDGWCRVWTSEGQVFTRPEQPRFRIVKRNSAIAKGERTDAK